MPWYACCRNSRLGGGLRCSITGIGRQMYACFRSFARRRAWRVSMPPIYLPTPPIKKDGQPWSAQLATLGARSLKAGHTRFFVGYKKHTLRLWLRSYEPAVLLVPLVSWATPAHVPEGYLLKPSIRQCQQRLGWRPDIVVGDLGYIHQATKKEIRQAWQVAVVTKLKSDMRIVE